MLDIHLKTLIWESFYLLFLLHNNYPEGSEVQCRRFPQELVTLLPDAC